MFLIKETIEKIDNLNELFLDIKKEIEELKFLIQNIENIKEKKCIHDFKLTNYDHSNKCGIIITKSEYTCLNCDKKYKQIEQKVY